MPYYLDVDVWCDFAQMWAASKSPYKEGPYHCEFCGATDHERMGKK